jgi:hypothetical protein
MQERVIDLLGGGGPLTGGEILDALGGETFPLWKACKTSSRLSVHRVGRRYVRLDRRAHGYARLSPSILREFLTYSVVGLVGDEEAIERRVTRLTRHIEHVTTRKKELATRITQDIASSLAAADEDESRFCVVLAGDIVYHMAHDVPRPERSTGILVAGSDLDIVVIVRDEAPRELVRSLDETIHQRKHQYLRNPAFREEIDFIVKRLSTLEEQMRFDTFKRMVACKIFDEAVFLTGSRDLYTEGKALLDRYGVTDRLREMEQAAISARDHQEGVLLATDEEELGRDDLILFYTDEESEEFE